MLELIKYALIMVLVTASTKYLLNQSKKNAAVDTQGNVVLRLPKLYGILGIGSCALGLGLMILGLTDFHNNTLGTALGLSAIFGGLGLPLILFRYAYRLTLTKEGIVKRNAIGQYAFLNWMEIKTVSYNPFMMELRMPNGAKQIKCFINVIGFDSLVDNLSNQLGKTRGEMGIPVF